MTTTRTTTIQIPARLAEAHAAFAAADKAARIQGPAWEERRQAVIRVAATYEAFQIECRSRGLDTSTMRALLEDPSSTR
ncbi:hypothetical protein PACID_14560 [Acidipropionibacterium acidipropionici ATCC 4875]|uniref:Uncharacterized protein n=1 Tax=Acidipropionibacterium acidipropionici (strain ATCC 4875 / DSM 20272 / JCM 6432 / NBRC 12425 / NCIMB 8070 / 4) TaxID=1171373 RepID=K7SJ15_ACIA4|nr:hypothetical protein [Acidipropionibacterium acidipropionici]AFV89270.1 hypothetical protein PACID_14560 [Acidipropionibacterium acidipropionici ATCC 4875]